MQKRLNNGKMDGKISALALDRVYRPTLTKRNCKTTDTYLCKRKNQAKILLCQTWQTSFLL